MAVVNIETADVTVSGKVESVYAPEGDKDWYLRFQGLSGQFPVVLRRSLLGDQMPRDVRVGDRVHCDVNVEERRSGVALLAASFEFDETPPELGGFPAPSSEKAKP